MTPGTFSARTRISLLQTSVSFLSSLLTFFLLPPFSLSRTEADSSSPSPNRLLQPHRSSYQSAYQRSRRPLQAHSKNRRLRNGPSEERRLCSPSFQAQDDRHHRRRCLPRPQWTQLLPVPRGEQRDSRRWSGIRSERLPLPRRRECFRFDAFANGAVGTQH